MSFESTTDARDGLRVLLGVTGGIAAFKAPAIVRRLRERGHEVRCAMTEAARRFVSPLTLEVLTGHAVYGEDYLEARGQAAELHVDAAMWAEVLCVAPCTASTLARLSHGISDDFLVTTALMFRGPVVVAPAMHAHMWAHDAVVENTTRLEARGVNWCGPVEGALASGEQGWGRMAEPEAIVEAIETAFGDNTAAQKVSARDYVGYRVLVSAGPTHEPLDPVRFLGNRSSGRMGLALARAAALRGAEAHLVCGPISLPTPPGVSRVDVTTAVEMKTAIDELAPRMDLVVMAAAVADFRPESTAEQKIKKGSGQEPSSINLVRNPDILAGLADVAPDAVRVGFAAETHELLSHAQGKLESKRVDFLVANDVSRKDIGFESAENEVIVLERGQPPVELGKAGKDGLAQMLLDRFLPALEAKGRGSGD